MGGGVNKVDAWRRKRERGKKRKRRIAHRSQKRPPDPMIPKRFFFSFFSVFGGDQTRKSANLLRLLPWVFVSGGADETFIFPPAEIHTRRTNTHTVSLTHTEKERSTLFHVHRVKVFLSCPVHESLRVLPPPDSFVMLERHPTSMRITTPLCCIHIITSAKIQNSVGPTLAKQKQILASHLWRVREPQSLPWPAEETVKKKRKKELRNANPLSTLKYHLGLDPAHVPETSDPTTQSRKRFLH